MVEKTQANVEKTQAKAKDKDEFVNDCQFKGHELQENMADAKARAELVRQDVKGECEEK